MTNEVFTHNGTMYEGSLKDALSKYRNMQRSYLAMGVMHNDEIYPFEDFLKDNYKPIK